MRKAASIVFLLASIACATALAGSEVDRDADVYAVALAAVSGAATTPPAIVVRDRTATDAEIMKGSRDAAAEIRQRMPGASEALVNDLLAKAREPRKVVPAQLAKATRVKAEIVPDAQLQHAFEGVPMAEAWRRLASAHGGAHAAVTLSPVGYDAATGMALVYLRVECGGLCGGASLLRLKETDGAWRVVETQSLWAG